MENLVDELGKTVRGEWRTAREHLVGDDTEGVDVGLGGDVFLAGLLRGHVTGRAQQTHDLGLVGHGVLGDAEVAYLHASVGRQHDVGGLDVPVNDPAAVGVVECLGALKQNLHGALDGQQVVLVDVALEGVAAVEKLQHDVRPVTVLTGIQHAENIRMVERAGGVGLVEEQLLRQAARLGFVLVGYGADLDGDLAVGVRVVTGIHDTHAAASHALDDLVLTELLRNVHCPGLSERNGKYGHQTRMFL